MTTDNFPVSPAMLEGFWPHEKGAVHVNSIVAVEDGIRGTCVAAHACSLTGIPVSEDFAWLCTRVVQE